MVIDCMGDEYMKDMNGKVKQKQSAGKSLFCEYMEYMGLALEIPASNNKAEIMKFCLHNSAHRCYIVDVPYKFTLKEGFFDAMESLKNGVIWHNHNKKRIDSPNVIVLATDLTKGAVVSRGWKTVHIRSTLLEGPTDIVTEWDKTNSAWKEIRKRKLSQLITCNKDVKESLSPD